jgi:hypothetical protein
MRVIEAMVSLDGYFNTGPANYSPKDIQLALARWLITYGDRTVYLSDMLMRSDFGPDDDWTILTSSGCLIVSSDMENYVYYCVLAPRAYEIMNADI